MPQTRFVPMKPEKRLNFFLFKLLEFSYHFLCLLLPSLFKQRVEVFFVCLSCVSLDRVWGNCGDCERGFLVNRGLVFLDSAAVWLCGGLIRERQACSKVRLVELGLSAI
jgi:hypothetical protein